MIRRTLGGWLVTLERGGLAYLVEDIDAALDAGLDGVPPADAIVVVSDPPEGVRPD
jgi:hypothetical protein